MSALKNNKHQIQSPPEHPWNYIFNNIDSLNPIQIMEQVILIEHLDVRGIMVQDEQWTFETIASKLIRSKAEVFYTLFGLAITVVTGKIHPYVIQYTNMEWAHLLLQIRIGGEPIFVYACQQNIQILIQWMNEIMNKIQYFKPLLQRDKQGNTPIHFAVKRRQWKWTQRLIDKGGYSFEKNEDGKSPLMLAAPHHEHLAMFNKNNKEWFDALHDALIDGKKHAMWCYALIVAGADVNQPELYNSPLDSLLVFAKCGIDMNLPTCETFNSEQYRIMFLYGKIPTNWNNVLNAFSENDWVRMLHDISINFNNVNITQEYRDNIKSRKAITDSTLNLQYKLSPI